MERDIVKKIVYECAANQFCDEDEFYSKMSESPNDGEDLLLYSEVGFDSLDMVEFILALESREDAYIRLPDDLFDIDVTFRKVIEYIWDLNKNH